jgi:hypothetical protein
MTDAVVAAAFIDDGLVDERLCSRQRWCLNTEGQDWVLMSEAHPDLWTIG